MKTYAVHIVILFTVLILTGCGAQKILIKEKISSNEFLYMEEVYAQAKNAFSAGQWDETIFWYDRLNEDYPENPYVDESIFITGYIYKTFLGDEHRAEKCFKQLISDFPKSEFSNSAQFELDHLNEPDYMPKFEK